MLKNLTTFLDCSFKTEARIENGDISVNTLQDNTNCNGESSFFDLLINSVARFESFISSNQIYLIYLSLSETINDFNCVELGF